MRGQDKADRRRVRALVELAELLVRALERLARDAAVVRVLAPAAEAMVLLGEVRELEVEPERAQDERLPAHPEARVDVDDGPVASRGARIAANLLDEFEQPRPFLLDEHVAEDRPEQTDVPAQRGGGVRNEAQAR